MVTTLDDARRKEFGVKIGGRAKRWMVETSTGGGEWRVEGEGWRVEG